MELLQQMRFTGRSQRPATAYFITGADTALWMEELAAWGIPLASLQLLPIPVSRADNRPLGVLVICEAHRVKSVSARTLAYGTVGQRLYVPVEAGFAIDLTNADWERLLGRDELRYAWHPQVGLVAFEPHEVRSVADLLAPLDSPGVNDEQWDRACPGVSFPSRLASLVAEMPTSVEQIMNSAGGDIGSRAPQLGKLPGGLGDSFRKFGQGALGMAALPVSMLARMLQKLRGKPAPTGTNPGHASATPQAGSTASTAGETTAWGPMTSVAVLAIGMGILVSTGQPWLIGIVGGALAAGIASGMLSKGSGNEQQAPGGAQGAGTGNMGAGFGAAFQQRLQDILKWSMELFNARAREIDRLMKMLDTDPDEGLKYALPMHGQPGRGVAPPTSSLLGRNVDFSLGRLGGGGGPADVWDLPAETQRKLMQRYRDLAAREIQLGRHRRAAYIYAELLGDLQTAAATLVQGRYYREAAVLYRDKLKRPLDAAKCLEQGGLLQDAIPLYRQLGMNENVGDLYHRLQDQEQAEKAYRLAVAEAIQKRDYMTAARIFHEKIQSPDEALSILNTAWKSSVQARLALEKSFEILGTLGRHDQARENIQQLDRESWTDDRTVDIVEVLSKLVGTTAHQGTRVIASDVVRRQVSKALLKGHLNRQVLVSTVSRLAPSDRLLKRDCDRAGVPGRSTTPVQPITRKKFTSVKTYQLPPDVAWMTACENETNFYVAGIRDGQVIVSRGAWHDPQCRVTTLSWLVNVDPHSGLVLCPDPAHSMIVLCSTSDDRPFTFPMLEFPTTDFNPRREQIGTPYWLGHPVSALAVYPNGMILSYEVIGMHLQIFDMSRSVIANWCADVYSSATVDPSEETPMAIRDDMVYLGTDTMLIESQQNQPSRALTFSDTIIRLKSSPRFMERRLAVMFREGGVLVWNALNDNNRQPFGAGVIDPRVLFLRDGRMIVHGRGIWEAYSTAVSGAKMLASEKCPQTTDAFALLQASNAQHVALCTTDGKVTTYRVD